MGNERKELSERQNNEFYDKNVIRVVRTRPTTFDLSTDDKNNTSLKATFMDFIKT